jgi:hypothetical protein
LGFRPGATSLGRSSFSLWASARIAAALHEYRQAMQNADFTRNVGIKGFDFDAAAAHNKQQLRQRLERASQKRGPAPRGPMA